MIYTFYIELYFYCAWIETTIVFDKNYNKYEFCFKSMSAPNETISSQLQSPSKIKYADIYSDV